MACKGVQCIETFLWLTSEWCVSFSHKSCREKNSFGVSDQVRHKTGCTVTGDGLRLEISGLLNRGIVLFM